MLSNENKYTPLNFSEEFYVPDSVPITTPEAPLCFLYIIQSDDFFVLFQLENKNMFKPWKIMQTFFMINVDYFFVINVVDLTLTNCKAHPYYICEIIAYVTMFVLWAITGYLCYKFEFVDYANIFVFDWPWKLIRGGSLNIHPWMKVHPWMGSAYSSVDESSSVDGECVFIRGWNFIRGWVVRILPWMKVHPWMESAYSSVD